MVFRPPRNFLKQRRGPQGVLQKDGGVPVDEYLGVRGLEDVLTIGTSPYTLKPPLG